MTYGNYGHTADAHLSGGATVTAKNLAIDASVAMPWVDEWQKGEGLPIVLDKLKIVVGQGQMTN